MLGHVFENLLIHEDRRAQGAYYTPPEIAEKQVKSAIKAFLNRHGSAQSGEQERILEKIRILDPSCGSGTYLVAAFQALLGYRLSLAPLNERYNGKLYALKRAIVLENLFGVDINPMAVRLTEVRLWLNMIQDLEIADPSMAPALPNLQHHLRPGDFLGRHGSGDPALMRSWSKYPMLERLRRKFPNSPARDRRGILKHIYRLEGELHRFLCARESGGSLPDPQDSDLTTRTTRPRTRSCDDQSRKKRGRHRTASHHIQSGHPRGRVRSRDREPALAKRFPTCPRSRRSESSRTSSRRPAWR